MAPNKTLAAQLYAEFKELFPHNAVEYFVSYYDYYQPEAYIPSTDTYIEKDSSINDEIDKLRHSTTHSLLTRRDVLVVASVSSIYGLGAPEHLRRDARLPRGRAAAACATTCCAGSSTCSTSATTIDFHRGTFRVRGDVVEVFPQYENERALRIEFFGDEIESIAEIDPLRGEVLARPQQGDDLPGQPLRRDRRRSCSRAVVGDPRRAAGAPRALPRARASCWRRSGSSSARSTTSRCSRRWASATASRTTRAGSTAAPTGQTPYTLFDYFPDDLLVVLDESHISRAADRRHVPRRPRAQGDAGRVRLPAAVGARQPAAALRRVGGARAAAHLRLGDARRLRARAARAAWWSSRSSGRRA